MPISSLLSEGSFDPDATRAMGIAFEKACQSLGLHDAADETTMQIAIRIIEAAKAGERDPAKLHEAVMTWAAGRAA